MQKKKTLPNYVGSQWEHSNVSFQVKLDTAFYFNLWLLIFKEKEALVCAVLPKPDAGLYSMVAI